MMERESHMVNGLEVLMVMNCVSRATSIQVKLERQEAVV